MNEKIGVLGGGSWGTALAILLGKKGLDVDIWLRDEKQVDEIIKSGENKKYLPKVKLPENLNVMTDVEKAIFNKDIILLAVPTHGVRGTLMNFKKYINKDQVIVNVAKGIENDTLMRISEIVKRFFQKINMLFYQDLPMQRRLLKIFYNCCFCICT